MTEEKSLSRATDDARREAATHLASAEYKMVTATILLSIALEETKKEPVLHHRIIKIWSLALSLGFEADDALRAAIENRVVPKEDVEALWEAAMTAKRFVGYGIDFGSHERLDQLFEALAKEMATSGWRSTMANKVEFEIP